jgi:hypothetical protein
MMIDRKYTRAEIMDIAARGDAAMGGVPSLVAVTAHVAVATMVMSEVSRLGPLSPDFQKATRALFAVAELFVLACETGPVSGGKPS